MSLTCHEETGHVGRGYYKDASDLHVKMVWRVADMSATSRARWARGIWKTT